MADTLFILRNLIFDLLFIIFWKIGSVLKIIKIIYSYINKVSILNFCKVIIVILRGREMGKVSKSRRCFAR